MAQRSEALRVLLVEDHPSVRAAIASELEPDPDFEIVGQAASLAEARELLAHADVVILDLGLPDGSGADLIPELRHVNPAARAIMLSSAYDPAEFTRAVERGAAAVLDKMEHLGRVARALRRILAGDRMMPIDDDPGWVARSHEPWHSQ